MFWFRKFFHSLSPIRGKHSYLSFPGERCMSNPGTQYWQGASWADGREPSCCPFARFRSSSLFLSLSPDESHLNSAQNGTCARDDSLLPLITKVVFILLVQYDAHCYVEWVTADRGSSWCSGPLFPGLLGTQNEQGTHRGRGEMQLHSVGVREQRRLVEDEKWGLCLLFNVTWSLSFDW